MNRYFGAFYELLRKAGAAIMPQPASQPKPTVPSQPKPSAVPSTYSKTAPYDEGDFRSHGRKQHYDKRSKADDVVKRSFMQNPHTARSLHSYECPVCKHHDQKSSYLIGHKPLSL